MINLIPLYRQMAADGKNFLGLSILQHAGIVLKLIHRTGAKTLLDYGSGRGDQYGEPWNLHVAWGVDRPTLYDPAFPGIDELPAGRYDGVLCSDVLEHVPEDQLDDLIRSLFDYAHLFVWASVCTRLAQKAFADGRNLHVTLQAMYWWRAKFERIGDGRLYCLSETP